MEQELKPCPKGHKAEDRPHPNGIPGKTLARCSMPDCGWYRVQMTPAQWNDRAPSPDPVREALLAVTNLIELALPGNMGGTPDLFAPEGYSFRGWDMWEELAESAIKAARAALSATQPVSQPSKMEQKK